MAVAMRPAVGFEEPRFYGRVESLWTRGGLVLSAGQKSFGYSGLVALSKAPEFF